MPDSHPVPDTFQEYHCYDCFLALHPATPPKQPDARPNTRLVEDISTYQLADLQRMVDRLERELAEEAELTTELIQHLYMGYRPVTHPDFEDMPTSTILDALVNREKWRTQVHDPFPRQSNGALRKEILNRCLS